MGLIQAFAGAAANTIANQWLEYYSCDTVSNDWLIVGGTHHVSGKTKLRSGATNSITNGSNILVQNGQCMIITQFDRVVEICAEPGAYMFDMSSSPSIWGGGLGEKIINSFRNGLANDYRYGVPSQYQIYYVNLREFDNQKFYTTLPYADAYPELGKKLHLTITCSGTYAFRIADPLRVFQKSKDWGNAFKLWQWLERSQMTERFTICLAAAFKDCADKGIHFDDLALYRENIIEDTKKHLGEQSNDALGVVLTNIHFEELSVGIKDREAIEQAKKQLDQMIPGMPSGTPKSQPTNEWQYSCVTMNMGKSSSDCGTPKPQTTEWRCTCGTMNMGNFCCECGTSKPQTTEWRCTCGTMNKGKFCSVCGMRRR